MAILCDFFFLPALFCVFMATRLRLKFLKSASEVKESILSQIMNVSLKGPLSVCAMPE